MATKKKTLAPTPVEPAEIVSYKGFNLDWTCRGMRYAVGQTYQHDGDVIACSAGFHACEFPLDVFGYYPPGTSRYAEVRQSGDVSRDSGDTKIASARLTVTVELSLHEMITRAAAWVFARVKPAEGAASSTGYQGAASSTGDQGAASSTGTQGAASSTGYQGAASSTGYQGAASSTGTRGAASSTGYQGAASSTGYQGAASSTGTQGAASSTGPRGAASSTGTQGAASSTGYQGAASSTGTQGAASSTGYQGAASSTGTRGAAMAIGHGGRAMGAAGNALFLVYRDPMSGEILHAWAGVVGRDGVEPGVWYSLGSDGHPVALVEATAP